MSFLRDIVDESNLLIGQVYSKQLRCGHCSVSVRIFNHVALVIVTPASPRVILPIPQQSTASAIDITSSFIQPNVFSEATLRSDKSPKENSLR